MECKQRVPDQEALLLEFPGFVKAVQPALDSFGSQDAVSDLLAGSREALQLRLRPGDPLAHSIFGLKQPAQGILLRLSRKAGVPHSLIAKPDHLCMVSPIQSGTWHIP